jgi:Xaa-Pro aminopeptidase
VIHPAFESGEYEGRLKALRERMGKQDVAAAILTEEANYNYFSGYHHFAPWTTFCRPTFCLIPLEGEPVLLVHGFLVADAMRDCWFDDVRGYDSLTFAPVDEVSAICEELGVRGERIGMELGREHRIGVTQEEYEALRSSLSPSEVTDIGETLWDLRIIKSPAEVALMREAGRIAAGAYEVCFKEVRPGITEAELASVLGSAVAREGGRLGFVIMTSGAGGYDRVSGLPREKPLEKGDFLWIDLGVVYRGYWSDHSRAAVLGRAVAEQRDMWSSVADLTSKAMAVCRPGLKSHEIIAFLEEERRSRGLEFSFAAGRSGHGLGLMSTEPPHIAAYDATELAEGMTFTIEPGWVDQSFGVFVAEENVVLRADGCEALTETPPDLVEV